MQRRGGDDPAARVRQAAAIDPAARIRPQRATLDPNICRQRRLLLPGAEETDGAAVAAYRMLRTRLLHRLRANQWTTIAVTSADQNDGKTLTALNLAMSLAREKSREIVLLDLDMRNPSVCRTLGVTPPFELRRFLETGEHGQEMFLSVCSENLLVAGSTSPTEQASELLASARLEDLLGLVMRGAVDPVVLIDLPPVLLTDDALVVAPKVDAFLIVASEGTTERADIVKTMDLLKEFPIVGVTLNRAVDGMPGYNYGYETDDNDAAGKGT
ncbi:MAG: CpsD/CapB family tyrosine-protein kinase [Gammaproteobacteria bacterium]